MTARPAVDLSVYLVTDPMAGAGQALLDLVAAAVAGGVTCVQLRDKTARDEDLATACIALKAILDPRGIPLIVNDRPQIARAIGAAGVHVGQEDMTVEETRAIVGRDAVLGLSITDEKQLRDVDWLAVDHIGLGPVFATSTKPDHAPALGLDEFARTRALVPAPTVAIGGIGLGKAAHVIRAGADGLAVVSAICAAPNAEAAARQLAAAIAAARRGKFRS